MTSKSIYNTSFLCLIVRCYVIENFLDFNKNVLENALILEVIYCRILYMICKRLAMNEKYISFCRIRINRENLCAVSPFVETIYFKSD